MDRKPHQATDLNVQQLKSFSRVYSHSSYAAAAREIGMSVPTVWEQIVALERVYGTRLFKKTGRNIRPTEAAHRLYDSVEEILAGLDSTFELVREAGEEPLSGSISLLTGVRMMMEDLARPLKQFRRHFPKTRLRIRHGNNRVAEQLILAGEVDLALTLEPGPGQESRRIQYEPAYSIDFLAIAPRSHPIARKPKLDLRELVRHTLVVGMPGTHGREAFDQALHREQLFAEIGVETDNSGFTIACVRAGMGVGILAGQPKGTLVRQLAIRSLRRPLGQRRIVFMWKKGRKLSKPLVGIVECIRDAST